jgi:hypothetical protein
LEGLEELADPPEVICRDGSTIISPLGKVLDDLDLARIAEAKLDFDVVGHYARPDVF